jgi:hypothetical protein
MDFCEQILDSEGFPTGVCLMDERLLSSPDRTDADVQQMLDWGARTLELLSVQEELAKVRARRVELEDVLRQAKSGDVGPLRQWFSLNGSKLGIDSPHQPAKEVPDSPSPWQDWDSLRQISRSRLKEQFQSRAAISPPISPGGESTDRTAAAGQESSDVKAAPKRKDVTAAPKRKDSKAARERTIKGVAKSELEINETPQKQRTGEAKKGRRIRGVAVSAVAHLALIFGLALVTIQVPMGEGILEFEASASSESQLDALEFVESVESSELPESVPDDSVQWDSAMESPLSDLMPVDSSVLGQTTAAEGSSDSMSQTLSAVSPGSSKAKPVDFYGASATGNCFCFLIDGSATMRGAPWEAARAELIRSLHSMSEKQRFYVIFYNRDVSRIPDPETGQPAKFALYATEQNLMHAVRWLQALRVQATIAGGNQTTVLQAALELEPDAIFYLTDGEMTESVQRNVLEMLRDANRISDVLEGEVVRVPIHSIAFHSVSGIPIMRRIAEENRGQYSFVPPPPGK